MNNFIKKILIIALLVSPILIGTVMFNVNSDKNSESSEKVYIALEEEGRVAVVDTDSRKLVRTINLSDEQNGKFVSYEAHNVQVSPDGSKVLVTANVNRGGMGGNNENNEDVSDGLQDKLIIIDPITDTIVDSVQLGIDLHLAHVVVDKAGDTAYVNAQETGEVFVVDINKKTLISKFDLGEGTGPHGLRLAPDDTKLFIALVDGQAIASVDLTTKVISKYPLNGKAVQTAVTASGEYVFASVYDTKKVAWVNVQNGGQGYIDLPEDAQGPIQLYATPDSKYLYVVNQGHYFGQPVARSVHRIYIEKKMVDNTIVVGDAPHGIVVDKSGDFAYVTNLLSDDLSIVDTSTNKEVARLKVGKMPNGISIWNKTLGGTP